jgi:peptide chain release factor
MNRSDACTLLVSSGNGPGECQQAVGHILREIAKDAEGRGVEIDISERPGRAGPASAIVALTGPGAAALADNWTGVVLWRCQSNLRPTHRRKNWFAQVFELGAPESRVEINEEDVEMQAMRAGGPGGQHQNKTSSAIRARWSHPNGATYSVVVRADRSQHRNRRIAVDRLRALVAADLSEAAAARKGGARHLHHQLERGNPQRIFEGPGFREA